MDRVWIPDFGSIGKACEGIVTANLLLKGYEVYLGFGNTSCDLIAKGQDGKLYRVEVKRCPKSNYKPNFDREKCDILAVVKDNEYKVKFYHVTKEQTKEI